MGFGNQYQPFYPEGSSVNQYAGNFVGMNNQYDTSQHNNQQYNQMSNFQNPGNFVNQPINNPINANQFGLNRNNIIPGRMVENIDVLRSIEIPLDGNKYYFPKADGSEIYVKRWLENGSTETVRYVQKTDEEKNQEDNFYVNKLNAIENMLQQIQFNMGQRHTSNYKKPNPKYQQNKEEEQ